MGRKERQFYYIGPLYRICKEGKKENERYTGRAVIAGISMRVPKAQEICPVVTTRAFFQVVL